MDLARDVNISLRLATEENDLPKAQRCVENGGNPYAMDESGHTAFNRAGSDGLNVLDWLTWEAFQDLQKPIHERRWPQHSLNKPFGAYRSTLIVYGVKACSWDRIKEMIAARAYLGIVNNSGWTLIHCTSVMPNRIEVLPNLLKIFNKNSELRRLIKARSTEPYGTHYSGIPVNYGAELTALGLCRERIRQQGSLCPSELADYVPILEGYNMDPRPPRRARKSPALVQKR